jgi:hypothetical protein
VQRELPKRHVLKIMLSLAAGLATVTAVALFATPTDHAAKGPPPTRTPSYFVAPTGSDSNPCTSRHAPCASWNAAYQRAKPGSIVGVACGMYPPQDIVMPRVSRASSAKVTFRPDGNCKRVTVLGSLDLQAEHLAVEDVDVVDAPDQLTLNGGGRARIHVWPENISGPTPIDIAVLNGSANYVDVHSSRDVVIRGGVYGNQPNYGSHVGSFASAQQGAENILFDGVTFRDVYPDAQLDNDPRATCLTLRNFVGVTVRRSRFYNCQFYDIFMRSEGRWKWPQNKDFVAENNLFGPTLGAGIEFDSISCMDSGRNPSLNPNKGLLATTTTLPTNTISLLRKAGDRYYDVVNFPNAAEIRIGKYILRYTSKTVDGDVVTLHGVTEGTVGGGAGKGSFPAGTVVTEIFNFCGGTLSDGSPSPNPPVCQAGPGTCKGFYEGRFVIRYNTFLGTRLAWGTNPDPGFYALLTVKQYGNYEADTQPGFCQIVAEYYRYWDYNVFATPSKTDTKCSARHNRVNASLGRTFVHVPAFQQCRGTGDGGRAPSTGDCPPPPDPTLRRSALTIGAGRPGAYPPTDLEGHHRPVGRVDAGAVESPFCSRAIRAASSRSCARKH